MSERELICIGCPMGCPIVVKMEDESCIRYRKYLSTWRDVCKKGSN